jgi:hypothetical protein
MKDGTTKQAAKKNPNPNPSDKRVAVLEQLINVAEFTLKRSSDTEEQSEALECKKILQERLQVVSGSLVKAA